MAHFRRKRARWQEDLRDETGLYSYTDDQLGRLAEKIAGHIQTPGTAGYNDDRMVFMHTYQHYPQLIVHCICETDVIAALHFARKRGLKVTTRSGGHSTAGYSVNDQLVIDTGGIDHVLVDPETRRARVGPGTNFGTLNRVLHHYGLHVPGGGCETVAVAGYMQGGGYGFTSRLFGMNCDNVHAVRLVTPAGDTLRASADENSDLLWAVRGGTGNQFGVLIEIEYNLHPLGKLWGFGLKFPLKHAAGRQTAARVLEDLQAEYSSDDAAKMGHQALLMYLSEPKKPKAGKRHKKTEMVQRPYLLIRGLYDGTEEQCEATLGTLLAYMTDHEEQIELWTHKHYLHLNELLLMTTGDPPQEMPNVAMNTKPLVDSRIIAEHYPAERWRDIVEHFMEAPDKTTFIALEYYGGAINEVPSDATAFVHRDASLDIFSWAFWTFDSHREATIAWLDKFGQIAGAMSDGHRYQNYPRRGNADFLDNYFGTNLERLVEIKTRYDPENLFEYEQSIPPARPDGKEAPA